MNNHCEECNQQIHPARAELGYTTCISCAGRKPQVRGIMVFDDNLNPTLQVVPGDRFSRIQHMYDINTEKLNYALSQYES